jgi:hypothetical protein
MLREALAGQHGRRIRNGGGAGAKTVQRGRRAEREEKGQFEKFHGLRGLIVCNACLGLLAADIDISDWFTVKP